MEAAQLTMGRSGKDGSGGLGPARLRSTCPTPPGWGEACDSPKQPGVGLAWPGRAVRPQHPARSAPAGPRLSLASDKGEAVPPGTSCVRGKMAAPGPCCKEFKMEDAAARWSRRVSHPHKGRGLAPRRPPLPVTPWSAGHNGHLGLLLGTACRSEGEGNLMALEFVHTWWVETDQASPVLEVILGTCPFL